MSILVSIIIPVYNVEPYIRQCIESVIAQTMSEGVECIIVDDCGQDNSIAIAEEMIAEYQGPIQFSIIHHEQNKGLSGARNTGIRAAKGEWLYFLDSDDWIIPECIDLMMKCIKEHPDVDLVQGNTYTDEDDMNKWLHNCINTTTIHTFSNNQVESQHYLQSQTHMPMAQNRLISRQFMLRHKLYFMEGIIHEDEHWTMRAGRHVNSLVICPNDTYYYRTNDKGITSCYNERNFRCMCMICDDLARNIKYKNRLDEILYICLLLHSASTKYKQDALAQTSNCGTYLFRKIYDMYANQWFRRNLGLRERLKLEILISLIFLDTRIRHA